MVGGVVVVGDNKELADQIAFLQNSVGAIAGAFDSFLVLRSLKTLPLRMERHCANALEVARWLEEQREVNSVRYPGLKSHPQHDLARQQMRGFGGIVTIILKGDLADTRRFLENTHLFSLAESLGGVESLINHPALMTHASVPKGQREKLGVTDSLVRLSVGVEDVRDLIDDLKNALRSDLATRSQMRGFNHVFIALVSSVDFETGAVLSVMRVFFRSEKVKRNIRLIAHDPTVVPGTDVKDVPRLHHVRSSILHGACSLPRDHHANVLHLTKGSASNWCDVLRPFPAGFIHRTADRHSADLNEFKPSFLKSANLIRALKSFN